jgi:hypothetical protein
MATLSRDGSDSIKNRRAVNRMDATSTNGDLIRVLPTRQIDVLLVVIIVVWVFCIALPIVVSDLGLWLASFPFVLFSMLWLLLVYVSHNTLHIDRSGILWKKTFPGVHREIRYAYQEIASVEIPTYRTKVFIRLKNGKRIEIADFGSVIVGRLPEMDFGPGVAHGPRRDHYRLKVAIERRAGIRTGTGKVFWNG